jgi:hypothetical protein
MRVVVELIEILFLIEIILNFITAYRDRDTFEPEYRIKNIALNYVRHGAFISHVLTAFPYQIITHLNDINDPEEQVLRNLLILKLLRIDRLSNNFIPDDIVLKVTSIFFYVESRDDRIANERMILNNIKIIM